LTLQSYAADANDRMVPVLLSDYSQTWCNHERGLIPLYLIRRPVEARAGQSACQADRQHCPRILYNTQIGLSMA
jgi:hypothetical protein